MNTNKTLLALLFAGIAAPAMADDAMAPAPTAGAPVEVQQMPDGKVIIHHGSVTFTNDKAVFDMNMVRNAPYSAEAVNERQQTLGDGNQISQRRDSATWYRDSAGRTRLETRDDKGELRNVVINDPVAGAAWTLDPRKRSALKVAIRGRVAAGVEDAAKVQDAVRAAAESARAGAEAAQVRVERLRKDDVIVKRVDGTAAAGMPSEIRIKVPKVVVADGALQSDMAPLGRALAGALNDREWKANTVTKDLGARNFDGVKAEGKLRSYEIPAGAIGNRNPIVVSDETWYAPELQITVYTKHSDPRSGDTVFRLENLKRTEPAATLFSVPADYTVRDPMARPRTE
jgi:hypothetical protein